MPISRYDLAIVGSGGAAFAAAIQASKLGKRVAMIECSIVGGTCVNTGCIPSKALLAAAEVRHASAEASRFPGLQAQGIPLDMAGLMAGKRGMIESMREEKYLDLINDYGWDLRRGFASFVGGPGDPALEINRRDGSSQRIQAAHYLLATGSAPWVPPVIGLDETGYLTSTTAMELDEVPESLVVIGGGFVALEQAQLFSRLGSKVTMLVRSRLASNEEPEASAGLSEAFEDEGIQVIRRAVPESVRRRANGQIVVRANVAGTAQEFHGTQVLVATGRRPVTRSLNLDAVGVATGGWGEVAVDKNLRTTNPRIWAAGDVTGHHEFVYVAAAHGAMAVENAFSAAGRSVDYRHLPRVAFTSPALAAVGMTDREARESGIACECRVLPLDFVPRAIVNRDTRGFIKIVAESGTGRILGITALAKDAGELAAAGVYILEGEMTVDMVANSWAPYLTMAEGLKIAAQAYSTDVSRLSCCAV